MSWTNKIIKDFIYKIENNTYTGYKGAFNYATRLEQQGITDEEIQNIISRSSVQTVDINTEYIKLKDVK